jgi:ABC-type phosphate/phosphonate transport system substrate-binding protein
MKLYKRLSAILLLGSFSIFLIPVRAEERESNPVVSIGMVSSFLKDVPDTMVDSMSTPFTALMTAQTGTRGKLVKSGDANTLARELSENRVKLGIFHGVEFAWARQKYPQLRPLAVAVNTDPHLRAVLVARADSGIDSFAGLKGQTLALPKGNREHCMLFLDKRCTECGGCPVQYLGQMTSPATAEDALDDVVDGVVRGAVVDNVALECFKRRKPGRFAKLHVAVESEVFPTAVVAYDPAVLSEEQARRFQQSMLVAHQSPLGKQLMTLWRMTDFQLAPDDYEQNLTDIAKAYPPPTAP